MKKLPFDPEEITSTSQDSDFWWWFLLILAVAYFMGRILVTIIFGI